MQTSPHRVSVPSWQPVRGIEDLEFLVKESEVLTGRSGRLAAIGWFLSLGVAFVIGSAAAFRAWQLESNRPPAESTEPAP